MSLWCGRAGGGSDVVVQPHIDSLSPLSLLPAAVEAAIAPAGGRWVVCCEELRMCCNSRLLLSA